MRAEVNLQVRETVVRVEVSLQVRVRAIAVKVEANLKVRGTAVEVSRLKARKTATAAAAVTLTHQALLRSQTPIPQAKKINKTGLRSKTKEKLIVKMKMKLHKSKSRRIQSNLLIRFPTSPSNYRK